VADGNEIPPFGAGQIVMDLQVPNASQGSADYARVQVGVNFFSPGLEASGFKLIVSYDLSGSFRFANDRTIIEIPENEKLVVSKVPILITPPMTSDQLELKVSPNLRDFSVKIVKDDLESTLPYVALTIPRHSVDRSGIVGELILRRPDVSHVAGTMINVRHQENLTLRPESLRLSRDNESKPYEATAMLRISLPADVSKVAEQPPTAGDLSSPEHEKQSSPASPEVELLIGGRSARVQVQRLGKGSFYRVNVRYDGPLDMGDDETLSVRWRILFDGRERVIDSQAFVPAGPRY
jgi:hypothetical protein